MDPPRPPTTCPICVTPFDAQERRVVTCNHCKKDACRVCVGEYLLSSAAATASGAPCMHCRAFHTLDFLEAVLQKKFVKGSLVEHRKAVLLRSEMERMQLSQPFVEHDLAVKKADALVKQLEQQESEARPLKKIRVKEGTPLAAARRVRRLLQLRIGYNTQGVPYFVEDTASESASESASEISRPLAEKRPFIFKCPKEGCRAFMDASFTCSLCETAVCACCRAVKAAGEGTHACNPDDVSSVRHIVQVSKPCPKCGVNIIRSEGCDQMWCTAPGCETAFSYSTGAIITHGFHNPHFREFLDRLVPGDERLLNRDPNPDGCAGGGADRLDEFRLYALLQRDTVPAAARDFLISVTMLQSHIFCETLPEFRPPLLPPQWEHHDLRMRFLDPAGAMSEVSFKRTLLSRDNTARYKAAVTDIFDMVRRVCRGKLQDLASLTSGSEQMPARVEATERELRALVDYANGCLQDVSRRFNRSVAPTIHKLVSYNRYVSRHVEALVVTSLKM